ncbi:M14 family metallopeptidase, partial [Kaarinaea lacus]
MLNIIQHIPKGLLTTPPTELYTILDKPTLIHLSGHREPPLFVSVLLHGNETAGYYAIQELLKKYHNATLPRSLSIFIGNIEAAKFGRRRLDNQVDYNRIWTHSGFQSDAPEAKLMQQVVDEMRRRKVFVSIDIHNNSGLNPHYACVNRMDNAFYQLAILFSRTVIYFIRPQGVQSQAFAEICPAVTVECGKTEHRLGVTHAMEYIESCLGLSELPNRPVLKQDMDLFHTVAIVKVP